MMDSHNSHRIKSKDIAFVGKSYQLNESYTEPEGWFFLWEKILYADSWMSYERGRTSENFHASLSEQKSP